MADLEGTRSLQILALFQHSVDSLEENLNADDDDATMTTTTTVAPPSNNFEEPADSNKGFISRQAGRPQVTLACCGCAAAGL